MHRLFWHVKEKIESKVFRLQKKKCLRIQSFSPAKEKMFKIKSFSFTKEELRILGEFSCGEEKLAQLNFYLACCCTEVVKL